MADKDVHPLARTLAQLANIGMRGHEVSAAANTTIGLSALANGDAPIPLALLDEWQGHLNQIRTSRRNPLPPRDKGLRIWEDGAPG